MSSVTQTTPGKNGMRVVGYVRVSSEEQVEGYSLDAQESAIKRYALERGLELVGIYRDEGQSAFGRGDRIQFNRLIRDAGKSHFGAVIVHKWDRFGRNREEVTLNKIMLRKKCEVKIFSVTEPSQDDENSKMGMLVETVLEGINHWYSMNLGDEVAKACLEKHEQGYHLRSAPFGYDTETRNLIINGQEAIGVVRAFETYSTGQCSYTDVADMLNEMGFRTKTGRRFSKDNVREMLRNPIYIGKVRYQRTMYKGKHRSFAAPVSIRDGLHEGIIDQELFDKVQAIQVKRKNKQGKSNFKPYLLRGMMYCERCADSRPDNALPSWARMYCRQHSGHLTRYVYCDSKHRGHGECGQHGVVVDVIEKQVIDLLSDLKPGNDWREKAIQALAGRIGEADVLKRLEELRSVARNMDFRFDQGLFVNAQEYLNERRSVQEQLDKLTPLLSVSDELEQAASLLNDFALHFAACGGDIGKQYELIKLIIERVYIRDNAVTRIVFTNDCEIVLAGGGILQYVSHKSGREGT